MSASAGEGPEPSTESSRLTGLDGKLILALTAVALALRFWSPILPDFLAHPFSRPPLSNCVRDTPVDQGGHRGTLCGLAYPYQPGTYNAATHEYQPPEGEVFDEIYFGRFAHFDLVGVPYFDDKPPMGKLLIAAGEWTWGWFRAAFQGAHGSFADLGFNPFGWRLAPCLFGTLLVPLMYLLALRLWPNRLFAGLAALFTCFDGLFFTGSRFALLEIFVAFFIVLAYWLFLVHLASSSPRRSTLTLVLTGVALGCGIATKWSVLAAWGVIVVLLAAWILRFRWARPDAPASGVFDYPGGPRQRWAVPGGERLAPYLITAVLALVVIPVVIYTASWFPFFLRGQFHTLGDIVNHDYQAYLFNATLKATHPYGSKWYTWPFIIRPVLYYFQSSLGFDQFTHQPLVAAVNDMGNPWIWWTSLPCLLALLYFVWRRSWAALLIVLAFAAQYLPWARVSRVLFFYEMTAMLPFMVLALAFVLTRLATAGPPGRRRNVRLLVFAHAGVAVFFFAYFYPLWTGLPISSPALFNPFPSGKIWLPTWI